MDKDYITIKIENYNGKNIAYKLPSSGIVKITRSHNIVNEEVDKLTVVNLELVCSEGIEVEEEEIIEPFKANGEFGF